MRTNQTVPTARTERAAFAWTGALAACLFAMGIACSSDTGPEKGSSGKGGNSSGGASASVGSGSSSSGGSRSSGASDSSSSVVKGGSGGSGGSVATGGSSGGDGSGGATGTGGRGTGGSTSTGGTSASAGRTGTGGGTGGRSDTGGTSAGGAAGNATGGSGGAGGTGGRTETGGRPDGGPDGRPDGGPVGGGGGTVFNPCTAGTTCKIMPLGDSITEGCCSNTWGGYRIELFRQAVKAGKNITFVGNLSNGPTSPIEGKTFPQKHEGHGGWTISQISGIADSTLSANKPDIVLLKIGTNDVNGTGASGAPNGLKNLINQITKDVPSALLVVSSIIPIKDDNTNNKVKTYNATIPTAVKEAADAGKHVIFVDSYAAYLADSSWKTKYMGDNLHPNQAGYDLLGQTWYAAISAVLP